MRTLIVLGILALARVAAASCSEEASAAAGLPIVVDAAVEPQVCAALVATIKRMPAEHRKQLAKVHVRRQHDLGVPADAPLIYLMLSAGTLAFYDIGDHHLVVTDAGAAGRPGWTGASVPAASVEPLLAALGFGWDELARRAGLPGKPVGDAAVLDALVKLCVGKLLGGEVGLEGILAHEVGHLVQLDARSNSGDVAGWATVSGWMETQHNEPADGYVGGMFSNEAPIVALRLALGMERGPEARYQPGEGHFPTDYGRFDPMEDFAEAYRFLLTAPEKLTSAPEKWVAVAGFETGKKPPPVPPAVLDAGARRLLGRSPGPPVDAWFALAVLEGRGAALEPLARELGGSMPRWPKDLPREIVPYLGRLGRKVGKATLYPEPKVLLDTAAAAVGEIEEMREFNRGLDAMVDDGKKKRSDDPAYDRLIGAENAARELITDGKLAEARRAIPAIKGTAVGARARARLYAELCRAHKARGESADADTAAGAARVARDEVFFPGWRAKLGDC